jgi:hypothetical protein
MKVFVVFALVGLSLAAGAQTFNDPVPIQGNAVTNAAASSAMYSAMMPNGGGSARTPEQSARRLADLQDSKDCRARAMQHPPGKTRNAIRDGCKARFNAARQYWK